MKKKIGIQLVLIISILIFFGSSYLFSIGKPVDQKKYQAKNPVRYHLRTSAEWNLTGTPIYIDDSDPNFNWSKTASENDWCTGTAMSGYYLQNILIDGQGEAVNLIEIRNSNVDFVIKNCELYNTADYGYSAIYLSDVQNGNIANNDCYDCGYGIILDDSTYAMRVSSNYITNNYYDGIKFDGDSEFNIIYNNTIRFNNNGINFEGYSSDNEIKENIIYNNTKDGIYLDYYTGSNNITGNNIFNNGESGISLYIADLNNISLNTIYHSGVGIELSSGSNWNILSENIIYDCIRYDYNMHPFLVDGVIISSGSNNVIENNQIHDSNNGINLANTHDIDVIGNIIWASYLDDISLKDTNHITLTDNTMTGSGIFIDITDSYIPNVDINTSNTVNGKPIYFHFDQSSLNSGDFINAGQIYLYNCSQITISNLDFPNTTTGITLKHCNDTALSFIEGTSNSRWGIKLTNCVNNEISHCTINEGGYCTDLEWWEILSGIGLDHCFNNYITDNIASYNYMNGIILTTCNNSIITGNIISNNQGSGLGVGGGNLSYVFNNTANYNGGTGIGLGGGYNEEWELIWSSEFDVISNIALSNSGTGIVVSSIVNASVSENIAHNNHLGIKISKVWNSYIFENEANENDEVGIGLYEGQDTEFFNNTAKENYYFEHGYDLMGNGFVIDSCQNVEVYNNYAFKNFGGLLISGCSDCEIKTNILNKNGEIEREGIIYIVPIYDQYGLILENSEFVDVLQNSINNNYIKLINSHNNSLILNDITWGGFILDHCNQNIILGNVIYRGERGVDLIDSSYNQILNNSITSMQCFRELGHCIHNVFENNYCKEELPYFPLREIMTIIGVAGVLGVNIPLFIKKRKKRE